MRTVAVRIENYHFFRKGRMCTCLCIKSLDGNKINWQQWLSLGRIGNLGTGEGQQFFTAVFGTYECIIYSKHKIEIKDCVLNCPCFPKLPESEYLKCL